MASASAINTIHTKTFTRRHGDHRRVTHITKLTTFVCTRDGGQQYRSYQGADVGSDHYLVKVTIKLRLKRRQEQRPVKPFAVEKLKSDNSRAQYQLELSNRFQHLQDATNIEEQWALFRKAVSESAEEVVGRRRKSQKE